MKNLNTTVNAGSDQHLKDQKVLFNLSPDLNNFLLNECTEGKIQVEKTSQFYNVFHIALQNTLAILKEKNIDPSVYYVGEGDDKFLGHKINSVEKLNYNGKDCIFIDVDNLIDELIKNNINNISFKFLNFMVLTLISKEAKDSDFALNTVKNI